MVEFLWFVKATRHSSYAKFLHVTHSIPFYGYIYNKISRFFWRYSCCFICAGLVTSKFSKPVLSWWICWFKLNVIRPLLCLNGSAFPKMCFSKHKIHFFHCIHKWKRWSYFKTNNYRTIIWIVFHVSM